MTTQDWFVFCFALVILSSVTSSVLTVWWSKMFSKLEFGTVLIMIGVFFIEFLIVLGLYQLLQAG